ncbi:hypothetical protein DVH24_007408 [Malus domestica]|uniref:Uncharacterized protein n=1 Tax=Malus domestica TaxID=3750 RepID=A0A498HJS5_MALDO|nr:hypothetical protein DVH24_007408 [Malus domestica]
MDLLYLPCAACPNLLGIFQKKAKEKPFAYGLLPTRGFTCPTSNVTPMTQNLSRYSHHSAPKEQTNQTSRLSGSININSNNNNTQANWLLSISICIVGNAIDGVVLSDYQAMNADKRKRDDRGELEGKRARVAEGERNGGHVTVTEEEVEEFFAILRRIRVAAKHLGRTASMEWRPSFQVEDFEEGNESLMIKDPKKEEKQTEAEAEADSGLDLNSHPV